MKLSERDELEKKVLEILEEHQVPCGCEVCAAFVARREPMEAFDAAIRVLQGRAPRWVN